jgi:hypothetical protein
MMMTDYGRDERLCECYEDEEEDRPLTLRQLPGGNYLILCDECGLRVVDDDPKTFRELAEAAIMDLRHYAEDELPHRRLVSARAYEKRFQLIASSQDTQKGSDNA